jgi:hypothetical protein
MPYSEKVKGERAFKSELIRTGTKTRFELVFHL